MIQFYLKMENVKNVLKIIVLNVTLMQTALNVKITGISQKIKKFAKVVLTKIVKSVIRKENVLNVLMGSD